MKKLINILPIAALLTSFMACEESIDKWSGIDRINFHTTNSASDTVANYSFVFLKEDVEHDTVWLEVRTQGQIQDYPRAVKLKAVVPYDGVKATPGVHYVDFESSLIDADLKAMYAIPAGKNSAKLPIVLIRDKSLQEQTVYLRIVFEDNEYFQTGFSGNYSHRTIIFTDMLAKPAIWDVAAEDRFGTYGQVKHRFMIETANLAFDDEWMNANFTEFYYPGWGYYWDPNDADYIDYLALWFQSKVDERNAREGNILTEEDGTVVSFPVL